ncbi:MAG: hypothetical protein GYB68_19420, partial [Chloroflexi bacterium]|nr:hypothetical protein [Chloroflexota bacterium]
METHCKRLVIQLAMGAITECLNGFSQSPRHQRINRSGQGIIAAMIDFIRDVWQFATQQANHPVYQRELAGWSYFGAWRGLRRGCFPILLALTAAVAGCCALPFLPALLDPSTSAPISIFLLLILGGVFIAERIITSLVTLLATGVGSATVSSEIEAQSFASLRLTPIPERHIVLAKWSATVRQMR